MSKKKEKASDEPFSETQTQNAPELGAVNAEPEAPKAEETPQEHELRAEKEKFLRLAAEYDNYRRRTAKERESIFSDVRADTVLKFLPVYDNLSRALLQETADEAYRRGVEMTMAQLKSILECLGVTEIESVGKTFDPEQHNAVMHIEDESRAEGEVVLEFEKGFMLGGKVIRFSMVQVAN